MGRAGAGVGLRRARVTAVARAAGTVMCPALVTARAAGAVVRPALVTAVAREAGAVVRPALVTALARIGFGPRRIWLRVVAVALFATASAILPGAPATAAAVAAPSTSAHATTAQAAASAPPRLDVRAADLIEESSGAQLYGLNADARLSIASTTKLMTALVTLHHAQLRQVFTEPNYYPAPQDSQIGLVPGERMNVHDLMIALLLPSADDAAEDLAYNVGHGSISRFLAMMNARARELHLTHTHYTTPIGLDTPGNYSSARDLVFLARYLVRSEPFVRVVVAKTRAVLRTGDHSRLVINRNDLVGRYRWINGVKTGHTLDAGYVLVVSGTQNGMTLFGAVLGAPSEAGRDASALALLDYGFANFGLRTPVRAGEVLAQPLIQGAPGRRARLIATSTYTHVFPRAAHVRVRVHAPTQLVGPLPAHAVIGSATVLANGRVQAQIPLRLESAVPQIRHSKHLKRVVVLSATLSGVVLVAGAAIGLRMFWRGSTRG